MGSRRELRNLPGLRDFSGGMGSGAEGGELRMRMMDGVGLALGGVDGLASEAECAELMELARPALKPALVVSLSPSCLCKTVPKLVLRTWFVLTVATKWVTIEPCPDWWTVGLVRTRAASRPRCGALPPHRSPPGAPPPPPSPSSAAWRKCSACRGRRWRPERSCMLGGMRLGTTSLPTSTL